MFVWAHVCCLKVELKKKCRIAVCMVLLSFFMVWPHSMGETYDYL